MNALNVAASGMQVNQMQLGAAAQNIAASVVENQNTRQVVNISESSGGGVRGDVQRQPQNPGQDQMVKDQVDALVASSNMAANAKVIQSARQVESYLLDLKANQRASG